MDGPRGAASTAPLRDTAFELMFRLDAEDYRAFLRSAPRRAIDRAAGLTPGVGIGAVGALLGSAAMIAAGRVDAAWLTSAAFAGAFILYFLHRIALMPRYYRSLFAGQPIAFGEVKVVADMRGVASNVAEIVVAMPWSRIVRIVETDRHIFLMFARLAGVIVPKRAFASADEARRFAAFARSMAPTARR